MVLKVYLAGPLFTLAERGFNAELDISLTAKGYNCTLPQNFCEGLVDPIRKAERCIGELGTSNVVLLNCDGTDVESGSAFEAGYACAKGIPIIAYRTDSRSGGDNALWPMNLMIGNAVKVFIEERVFHKLEAALGNALAREEVHMLGDKARSVIASWPKWKQDFAEQWLSQRYNYDD